MRLTRLSIVQRVAAIGLLCLALVLALAVVLALRQWSQHQTSQARLAALPAAQTLLQLAKTTAEHRGMSAGFLGGNDEFRARREAKQAEVTQALDQALQQTAAWHGARLDQLRSGLRDDWAALAAAVAARSVAGPESFRRHGALVQRQLALLDEIAASTLALDPDAASHHLVAAAMDHQPALSEAIGQLRGFGAGMLAKPAFAEADKAFVASTLVGATRQFDASLLAVERALAAEPALRAAVAAPLAAAGEQFAQAVRLVDDGILKAAQPQLAGTAFFAGMTNAIDAQSALATTTFTLLHDELEQRVAAARRAALLTSLAGALLLACNGWLVLSMVRSIRRNAGAAIATAQAFSNGDFSQPAVRHGGSDDEFGRIAAALEQARQAMARAIGDVRAGVEAIATASREISQGSLDLSQRTERQASSLQETAASMEQLTGAVRHSGDNAREASRMASAANDGAQHGGAAMQRIVATMGEIAESSQRIAAIIGTIDGIAFQTNILALNAAVEAARAGEQGRGFAVVAAEVRALAQRCAAAAREIKTTIAGSSECVESGGQLVGAAGRSIGDIVGQVQQVSALIGAISAAAGEQSRGIEQINAAVSTLDEATQQNSALAEQSAAAAASLRTQSQRLADAVGAFRLG